jgi:hypothetical protein
MVSTNWAKLSFAAAAAAAKQVRREIQDQRRIICDVN